MLQNHFKIAFRNLWRYRLYTFINVIGLAIGISACLAIYTLVHYENSFDTFHTDRERIYRVYSQVSGSFEGMNRGVAYPLAEMVRKEFTGIEVGASVLTSYLRVTIETAGQEPKVFEENNKVVLVEPQYFQLFKNYQWLAGSPQRALTAPYQVVLMQSQAKLYFGNTKPSEIIGREIIYQDSLRTTVVGVVADWEQPSDFNFTDYLSKATVEQTWLKNNFSLTEWGNVSSSCQFFIKLEKGVPTSRILPQLDQLATKYVNVQQDFNGKTDFRLQAFSDLHFNPKLGLFDFSGPAAHRPTLHALLLVAGLMLVIAAINFVNLATAQAVQRSKEVGVRKVLGSTRRMLVLQFLSETFVVTVVAVLMSVLLADLAIRFFHEFLPKELTFEPFSPAMSLFIGGIILTVTLLAGLYPAFVLSAFKPVVALKNQFFAKGTERGTEWLRKSLIVFQFTFSLALIAGTLIIGRQIHFMQSKDMGFRTDAVVHFHTPYQQPAEKTAVLKNKLEQLPSIRAISENNSAPASNSVSSSIFKFNNGNELKEFGLHRKSVDTAYLRLYDIPLVAGRNVLPKDSTLELVINETAAKMLGFANPADAISRELEMGKRRFPIVGVVKDFHSRSLHEPIHPMALSMNRSLGGFSLKLATHGKSAADFKATMAQVEKAWKTVYPDDSFAYELVDETIAKFYENEQRTSKLMSAATGIAIFISCIGLFGLATFSAERRTKEIGIRKILGASMANIVTLLSKDLLILVIIAIALGSPIAWYFTNQWLEDFAYRITIQWWMFALAGMAAVAIALLTVSFQAVRAAVANPVHSLRSE